MRHRRIGSEKPPARQPYKVPILVSRLRPPPIELSRYVAKHSHAVLEMDIAGVELHRVGTDMLQLRQSLRCETVGWRRSGTGHNDGVGGDDRREGNESCRSARNFLHDNKL